MQGKPATKSLRKETSMARKLTDLDDIRLRRVIIDNAIQHQGHFIAFEPFYMRANQTSLGQEFFFPVNHQSHGDEETPELDAVIKAEQLAIRRRKSTLRRRERRALSQ